MKEANNWGMVAKGYQNFAATSLATAQALTVPAGTQVAILRPGAQTVRIRDDGTAPTASLGMLIPVGEAYIYASQSISSLRIIETAVSATLDVLYYG
jgi:hypothetical protein